ATAAPPASTVRPTAAYYSTGGQLRGVAAASANNAWAVGSTDAGSSTEPLMLHWNGKSWSRVTSPGVLKGAGQLTAITVISAGDAWAVGTTGNPSGTTHSLLLHWNGAVWSQVTSPAPVGNAALYAVTATAKGGWAVGYYYKAPGSAVDYFPLIFRLSGTKWSRVTTKLGGDALLNGVAVTSAGATWATGSVVGMLDGILARWNGRSWGWASFPVAGQYHALSGIAAGPGGVAFAVGTDSSSSLVPLSMKWTGKTWQKTTVSAPSWSTLNTVAFAPGGAAWAAGTTGLTRAGTLILRWNGNAWTRVASPGTGTIIGLGFAASKNGWAVGASGSKTLILHWNGKAWSSGPAGPPPPATSYSSAGGLAGVAAASAGSAWAVGHAGSGTSSKVLMLHWNGSKWSRVTSPGVLTGPGDLAAITVVSAKDAWAVGYTGKFTTTASTRTLLLHWNGTAWSQVTRPAPVAGALSGVTATASRGWAVGYVPNGHNFPNSLALRLSGATWSRVSISGGIELVGAAITGTSTAWAVGYNEQGSELERWNGSKWTFEPSILPGDLYLMPAIAAGPGGTAFTVGVKQSASARPVPVILRLTGSSWHPVTVHAPSNGQLNAVAFAPGGSAWTAGSTGNNTLVLRWTGAAWARVASPSPAGSNEISGLGFAAAGNGWAVGTSNGKTLILHWNGKAWSLGRLPAKSGNRRLRATPVRSIGRS
ncbi:MAG: hypothetical protein ABSA02_29655, partial [Trebonia sp.]